MWNLVDPLSTDTDQRAFYLPIAALAEGAPLQDRFLIAESTRRISSDDATALSLSLNITIRANDLDFFTSDGVPQELIRLYAVDGGTLHFFPSTDDRPARLELILHSFGLRLYNRPFPAWWQRWVEAGQLPQRLVYENIDVADFAERLAALPVAPTDAVGDGPAPEGGLRFPLGVTESNKESFIADLLAGQPGSTLLCQAGAELGIAAEVPDGATRNRLLRLQAFYRDHTDEKPNPLQVRELLYLLFGDDSVEASTHPLLLRLQALGQEQTLQPLTRRTTLRPPLRTWKRVQWEISQERTERPEDWSASAGLSTSHTINSYTGRNASYEDADYRGWMKSSIFALEMALRAGFRVPVHQLRDTGRWQYFPANAMAAYADLISPQVRLQVLGGQEEDSQKLWGRKPEMRLRNLPANQRQEQLNDSMQVEGRCLLVAAARPRISASEGSEDAPFFQPGRLLLLESVRSNLQFSSSPGTGLAALRARFTDASGADGLQQEDCLLLLSGSAASSDACYGFSQLQLIELIPGRDPTTPQGIQDLNTINRHLFDDFIAPAQARRRENIGRIVIRSRRGMGPLLPGN